MGVIISPTPPHGVPVARLTVASRRVGFCRAAVVGPAAAPGGYWVNAQNIPRDSERRERKWCCQLLEELGWLGEGGGGEGEGVGVGCPHLHLRVRENEVAMNQCNESIPCHALYHDYISKKCIVERGL